MGRSALLQLIEHRENIIGEWQNPVLQITFEQIIYPFPNFFSQFLLQFYQAATHCVAFCENKLESYAFLSYALLSLSQLK